MKDQFNEETMKLLEEKFLNMVSYEYANGAKRIITNVDELENFISSRHLAYKEMLVKLGEEIKRGDVHSPDYYIAISDYQNIIRSN